MVHKGGWVFLYHLIKRGRTYYFRIRIPKDLVHYFPIQEVRKSLETNNLPAAKILYSSLEEKFMRLRISVLFKISYPGWLVSQRSSGYLWLLCTQGWGLMRFASYTKQRCNSLRESIVSMSTLREINTSRFLPVFDLSSSSRVSQAGITRPYRPSSKWSSLA